MASGMRRISGRLMPIIYRPQEKFRRAAASVEKVHVFFNGHFFPEGASYERVKFQSKRLHY
jgi:hypothetical protein